MRELSMREMGSIYGGEGGGSGGGSTGSGSSGGSDRGGGSNNGSSGGNGSGGLQYAGTTEQGYPLVTDPKTGVTRPTKWSVVFGGLTYTQAQAIAARDPVFNTEWNHEGQPSSTGTGRPSSGGR